MELSRRQMFQLGGLSALAVGGLVAVAASAAAADAPGINGYRNVGYFAQWGVYGRDFKLKQLDTSGAAADLTHINYAFANIHHQTLTCFEANKAQGTGPNGSDGAGDAWADYGMGYTAANSVSGVADTWDQPLAGSFNQLKQLKAKHPQLKVMMSIGGWTWSKNFSKAAATDASRKTFVSSCIDLFIKGNLPVIDGRGGAGSAAGVFDGFDLDWEWPGSLNGEVGNHVDVVNDRANFKALIHEFRVQLDALSQQTGKPYQLSAFLPANPSDIAVGGWNDPDIFDDLDFGNVQGYDLWGAWDPSLTGHQGNLYDDPADPRAADKRFSVDKAVRQYLNAGIAPSQLGLGMAGYGRGWQGVTSSTPWSSATGAAPGTYEAGNEDYYKLKTRGTDYYDATIGAAWRYDGNQWWSYDNAQTTAQKAQYVVDKGLGGGMWWELSGDRNNDLVGFMADKFRAAPTGPSTDPVDPTPDPTPDPTVTPTPTPTPDPDPGTCTAAAWSASATYTGGAVVSYQGKEYRAQWWTQNNVPSDGGVWVEVRDCSGTTPEPGVCPVAWSAGKVYLTGDTATYGGRVWQAQWWTQGETPGSQQWGAWKDTGACTD